MQPMAPEPESGALADLVDQALDAVVWDDRQLAKRLLRQIAAVLRGEPE